MTDKERKIDLVRAFMQFDGQFTITGVCYNYDKNGGVEFTGYKKSNSDNNPLKIVMNKIQIELVSECKNIIEVYECYKEMGYFDSRESVVHGNG